MLTLQITQTAQAVQLVQEPQARPGLTLVAHAGGSVEGYAGSNSLEALRNSAALGFRYIELDMLPTTDGHIVMTHDWGHIFNRVPKAGTQALSYEEFMNRRVFNIFTPLDLSGLIQFLDEHEHVRIITDTKTSNYAALRAIASYYPYHKHRFIPQAYAFADIEYIRGLGFEDVILTAYMMPYHQKMRPAEIAAHSIEQGVWGVTIPDELVTPEYAAQLNLDRLRVFVHTIDSPERAAELLDMGFAGIYTGFLTYDQASGELVSSFAGLDARMSEIRSRISALNRNPQHRAIIASSIFYRLDHPVYVHNGQITAVKSNSVAAPFASHLTGELYLPVHHFYRYTAGHNWDRPTMTLNLTISGTTTQIRPGDGHELVLYRDMIYLPASTITSLFPFELVRDGSYAALVPNRLASQHPDILRIAAEIFRQGQ